MSTLDPVDSFLFSLSRAFCSPLAVFVQIQTIKLPFSINHWHDLYAHSMLNCQSVLDDQRFSFSFCFPYQE
ncbi:unnamed protein product [Prunus armeniaca]|uniref:Uncharacterized protein n=1 Tax=Prunus armeniaca TaxID=36596 RepID=A0A6J5XXX0_PRUAR|nr:unnamed protein product [Prunus armeniaca]